MTRKDDIRARAMEDLRRHGVLMLDGHFDYGNGYHGRAYLNPHQLFRYPSTIWRLAQDLLDLLPLEIASSAEVVAGPTMGGALMAHTMAGLLDSRRSLTHPPSAFAPLVSTSDGEVMVRPFYRSLMAGKRVLLADDVYNTGQTLAGCVKAVRAAGGTPIASAVICDRMEAVRPLGIPLVALVEYGAPENYPAAACPLCASGVPISAF